MNMSSGPLPPGPALTRRPPGDTVHERDRYAQLRADQALIDRAAAQLRHQAVQDEYRGLRNPEHAYGCASILDVIALDLPRMPESVRSRAVEISRGWLGLEKGASDGR